MTTYQIEKGIEIKTKLDSLIIAHFKLSHQPINSRIVPFLELSEEANLFVNRIIMEDMDEQIRKLKKELENL